MEILCIKDRNYIEKKRYIFPVVLHEKSLLGALSYKVLYDRVSFVRLCFLRTRVIYTI